MSAGAVLVGGGGAAYDSASGGITLDINGVPHAVQNLAPSLFLAPHSVQNITSPQILLFYFNYYRAYHITVNKAIGGSEIP